MYGTERSYGSHYIRNVTKFSTKKYVVGTQKNPLNETFHFSTQNMLKLMEKKI